MLKTLTATTNDLSPLVIRLVLGLGSVDRAVAAR